MASARARSSFTVQSFRFFLQFFVIGQQPTFTISNADIFTDSTVFNVQVDRLASIDSKHSHQDSRCGQKPHALPSRDLL